MESGRGLRKHSLTNDEERKRRGEESGRGGRDQRCFVGSSESHAKWSFGTDGLGDIPFWEGSAHVGCRTFPFGKGQLSDYPFGKGQPTWATGHSALGQKSHQLRNQGRSFLRGGRTFLRGEGAPCHWPQLGKERAANGAVGEGARNPRTR